MGCKKLGDKVFRFPWNPLSCWSVVQAQEANFRYFGSPILCEPIQGVDRAERANADVQQEFKPQSHVELPFSSCSDFSIALASPWSILDERMSHDPYNDILLHLNLDKFCANKSPLSRYTGIQQAPWLCTMQYVVQDLIGNNTFEAQLFAWNDVKKDAKDG